MIEIRGRWWTKAEIGEAADAVEWRHTPRDRWQEAAGVDHVRVLPADAHQLALVRPVQRVDMQRDARVQRGIFAAGSVA